MLKHNNKLFKLENSEYKIGLSFKRNYIDINQQLTIYSYHQKKSIYLSICRYKDKLTISTEQTVLALLNARNTWTLQSTIGY